MLEFIFEVVGEFLLQVLGEALVELGFHSLGEPFRRPPNPWLASLGYPLFGAILGGLSLLAFSRQSRPGCLSHCKPGADAARSWLRDDGHGRMASPAR